MANINEIQRLINQIDRIPETSNPQIEDERRQIITPIQAALQLLQRGAIVRTDFSNIPGRIAQLAAEVTRFEAQSAQDQATETAESRREIVAASGGAYLASTRKRR